MGPRFIVSSENIALIINLYSKLCEREVLICEHLTYCEQVLKKVSVDLTFILQLWNCFFTPFIISNINLPTPALFYTDKNKLKNQWFQMAWSTVEN